MTAAAYKTSILHLLEDIDDEQVLGEAYIAIQEILHPEAFEIQDADEFENEIAIREAGIEKGEIISDDDMQGWIAQLTKS